MAINSITISQDNIYDNSKLLPIHSPLIFLVDVDYTGAAPTEVFVDLTTITEGLIGSYRCVPFKDLLSTVRQFAFVANDIIKGFMDDYDDIFQLNESFIPIPEITKTINLKFYDPDTPATSDENTFTFIHGAAQFGETPNLTAIHNNENDTYYCALNDIVYVYFYNDNEGNTITIGDGNLTVDFAQDFDDEIFTDALDNNFEILIPIS